MITDVNELTEDEDVARVGVGRPASIADAGGRAAGAGFVDGGSHVCADQRRPVPKNGTPSTARACLGCCASKEPSPTSHYISPI